MKQMVLTAFKACLGERYPGWRARVVQSGEIWRNRAKNLTYRVRDVDSLNLDRKLLHRVKKANRETLNSTSRWYNPDVFARSVCCFGIASEKLHLLDVNIGDETTLSDLITYNCAQFTASIRYLEIGVSVGKNFVQVINGLPIGSFTGFDIEDINPIIRRGLDAVSREEWPALDPNAAKQNSGTTFSRREPSILETFRDSTGRKKIRYVAGDVFDERCWQALAREKYDVIFSDALHTASAIKHEYQMMKKYDLFGEGRITIIWDDLHFPGMREAFLEITDDLVRTFGAERASRSLHLLYGWAGRHEGFRHLVGIFQRR